VHALRARTFLRLGLQPRTYCSVFLELANPRGVLLGSAVKEHVILGIDKRDVEEQRELWLSKNPAIKVLRVHGPRREPRSLLTRFGGKNIPRFSITVDYEESDIEPTHPSEK
jgi:hypothetical protein